MPAPGDLMRTFPIALTFLPRGRVPLANVSVVRCSVRCCRASRCRKRFSSAIREENRLLSVSDASQKRLAGATLLRSVANQNRKYLDDAVFPSLRVTLLVLVELRAHDRNLCATWYLELLRELARPRVPFLSP